MILTCITYDFPTHTKKSHIRASVRKTFSLFSVRSIRQVYSPNTLQKNTFILCADGASKD